MRTHLLLLAAASIAATSLAVTSASAHAPQPTATGVRMAQNAPLPGANSFTEGEAKSRIEKAGYADVTGLKKDDQGIWRGSASKGGKPVQISLDYKGNVSEN